MFFKIKKHSQKINHNQQLREFEFYNFSHLEAVKSSLVKTMQIDFDQRWEVETGYEDDEYAFAMAIAVLDELNIHLVSNDDVVIKYLDTLRNKQLSGDYRRGEKNNG